MDICQNFPPQLTILGEVIDINYYNPTKAISMPPYPTIDKKKCIRCFCCMEICPQHALSLGG